MSVEDSKPTFRYRRFFLVTSWLGPVVGLLALPYLIEVWKKAGGLTIISEGGFLLLISAGLYLGLWIVPWVTMRADSISDFKEMHAFGVTAFVTVIVALLGEALKFEFPGMSFWVFLFFFFYIRKIYGRLAEST